MQHKNLVDLSRFSSKDFDKGGSALRIVAWYFVNALFVRASWNPFMGVKIFLLRLFGAKIGSGFVIKNNVTIKYPWKLSVGDNVWLGENNWLDNLDCITIGDNVCISQGALLITGNHDYAKHDFPYRNATITVEEGAWIGAKAIVAPGVTIASYSVLTLGAVCLKHTAPYGIYCGNPACKFRERKFNDRKEMDNV